MPRNKKPIAAHFIIIMAFEGNLKRKSIDELGDRRRKILEADRLVIRHRFQLRQHFGDFVQHHDDIQASLEDMGGFLEVVRRELVKKSEAAISMGRLLNKREAEEEKKKPHCDKCGQVIPAKRRR